MELHRSRVVLIVAGLIGVGGIVGLILLGGRVSAFGWLVAVLAIPICAVLVIRELRPFRFRIGEQGLDVRRHGIKRLVGWPEIDALVLEQPPRTAETLPSPRLLLVPVGGTDLAEALDQTSPVDGRPARRLLDCDDVREPVDEIAAALTRFGGARFVDYRAHGPAPRADADFTVVLRGYEPVPVDELIRLARQALDSADPALRQRAKAQIEAATFVVALRGYDRGQVDAHLAELSARLASPAPETGLSA
jgi:DivIVA domain-containing protein